MQRSMLLAAGFAAAIGLASALPASAAPFSSAAPEAAVEAATQTRIEEVQYRRGRYLTYCQRQRIACAASYPSRGWRYRRCLAARGCW